MKTIESIEVIELPDDQPDLSWLEDTEDKDKKHLKQDKARLEEYNQGYWSMIGIRAKAVITINGTLETIETAGLWGIESDSDPSYLEEIGKEEKSELGEMLKEIGFSQSQIKEAEN